MDISEDKLKDVPRYRRIGNADYTARDMKQSPI